MSLLEGQVIGSLLVRSSGRSIEGVKGILYGDVSYRSLTFFVPPALILIGDVVELSVVSPRAFLIFATVISRIMPLDGEVEDHFDARVDGE